MPSPRANLRANKESLGAETIKLQMKIEQGEIDKLTQQISDLQGQISVLDNKKEKHLAAMAELDKDYKKLKV